MVGLTSFTVLCKALSKDVIFLANAGTFKSTYIVPGHFGSGPAAVGVFLRVAAFAKKEIFLLDSPTESFDSLLCFSCFIQSTVQFDLLHERKLTHNLKSNVVLSHSKQCRLLLNTALPGYGLQPPCTPHPTQRILHLHLPLTERCHRTLISYLQATALKLK